MKKNLLIGNGINQCTNSNKFSSSQIRERFHEALLNNINSIPHENLKQHLSNSISIIRKEDDLNIEQIAAKIYEYIQNNIINEDGYFSGNDDQRLMRIIKKVALEAIFIENNKFIDIEISTDIINIINTYENIFTLNYYEYGNHSSKATYLHGKVTKSDNNDRIEGYESCLFSPKLNEEKSIVEAVKPSEHLYPADDLTPGGKIILYDALDQLDEIDIFGVSPFGDKELISKINTINKKKVFIYNMNTDNEELLEWKNIMNESKYLDSTMFINKRQ